MNEERVGWAWQRRRRIRVGTHGCPHHVDELVAVSLLRHWARSRGQEVEVEFLQREDVDVAAGSLDVLVDIGGRFDPSSGRFDHHQGGPEVEGRSAAGLVFDTLFGRSHDRAFLEPVIRYVDWLDTHGAEEAVRPTEGRALEERTEADVWDRGASLLSLSALLKAVGGFRHDVERSRKCLEIMEALVASWFRQARNRRRAGEVVRAAETVGDGIFLPSSEWYGPGLVEYLREETDFEFVGFPADEHRFLVVAIRDVAGHNRVTFPSTLDNATFVHKNGHLAVFDNKEDARESLRQWRRRGPDAV